MDGSWDFLYVPMRVGGKSARGYAFLNFATPTAAEAFRARWHGQSLAPETRPHSKLNVHAAEVQGWAANVNMMKKDIDLLKERKSMPIVLYGGRPVALDAL